MLNKFFGHLVDGLYINQNEQINSLMELLKDKRQRLILYPMNKGSYLELLIVFYINVLKFNGSGKIFHQTELNDWLTGKCNFFKFNKHAQSEDMEGQL